MDKRRNETVERFISRIRAEIYNLAPVDDYLEVLRNDLYEYQENNPECTEEDLESEFGTPVKLRRISLRETMQFSQNKLQKGKRLEILLF